MSIEEARMGLLAVFGEALQGALTTGRWHSGGFTDEIDRLILEVQAAMPCYGDCLQAIGGSRCPSCQAREKLKVPA